LGVLKHLGCEIDGVVDFLKTSYPENESVLVGCRASPGTPYECCEYDVIVLNVNGENSSSSSSNSNSTAQKKYKKNHDFHQIADKKLEVFFLDKESLFQDKDVDFLDYVNLTKSALKGNLGVLLEEKKSYNQKNIGILSKRRSMQFALFCTKINKQMLRNAFNSNLCSVYLKMMSFRLLELLIQLFNNEIPKPTHLKYQMNSVREKNTKTKEHIDTLSEYLELDRSNVSTVTRSEKSLIFLLNHAKRHSNEVELFESKVNFFKKKSMYVDANLLVHSYVKRHSFDENYVNDYSRIMNPILDVQVKEKTVLLKELEVLFSINKSAVKNNY
jgi:hypothetical protein